ncbi:hypothetical protein Tco_0992398 [Tanacetum coccineum]|uniref:Uncharacterized protein n=1 Tax=Tanacetum coccineum TaxID=301880 RepID=A0ABQ5F2G2_9ASTR
MEGVVTQTENIKLLKKGSEKIRGFKRLWVQLELLGEKLSQEDVNKKLLRNLSPEWNTHAVYLLVQPNSPQLVPEDFTQISIQITWRRGRKLSVNGNETIGFDMSSGVLQNAIRGGHCARDRMVLVDMTRVIRQRKGLIMHSWLSHLQVLTQSLNKLIECQIVDNCKKGLGYKNYNAVPPPYIGNFMPPTPDLSFTGLDEFVNKPVVENCKAMSSEEEPKVVRKNDDAPIIKEWVSDDEEEDVSQPKIEKKIVRPSIVKKEFVKSKQQEKTTRKTVKQVEQHRQNTHSPRGNQRNWNNMMSQKLGSNFEMFNKACYVCGSFDHLQLVVLVNTARQVNAAHSKTTVNAARPMPYLSKTTHLTVKRPIHKNTAFKNSNINQSLTHMEMLCPKSRINILRGCGLCEEVRILFSELIFAFPVELRTSLGVPLNFDDWDNYDFPSS